MVHQESLLVMQFQTSMRKFDFHHSFHLYDGCVFNTALITINNLTDVIRGVNFASVSRKEVFLHQGERSFRISYPECTGLEFIASSINYVSSFGEYIWQL